MAKREGKKSTNNNELVAKILAVMQTLRRNGIKEVNSTVLRDKVGTKNRAVIRRVMKDLKKAGKVDISEKDTSSVLDASSTEAKDMGPSPPKASFRIRLNETDNLQLAIWSGKKDPDAEVIVAKIQSRQGDDWKNIGKIAVYRFSDGEFRQLPERKP